MDNKLKASLITKLYKAFPKSFINKYDVGEIVIYPATNTCFRIDKVKSELEMKCKVLEHCSKQAYKSISEISIEYHRNGINSFLGQDFTVEDMKLIYIYIGDEINRDLCIEFIESDYDMNLLSDD